MTTVEALKAVQDRIEAVESKLDAIQDQQKISRANMLLLVAVLLDHLGQWLAH